MCGIYGMVSARALRHPHVLEAMGESLRHRGPDGRAFFEAPHARIATERLRIIDLHERADQPFASPDDRVWLEANGEIYNAAELAQRLQARGVQLRGGSDSEVLLETFAAEGRDALRKLRGMYAFAIWDTRNLELICARDPFGIKPLYYTLAEGGKQLRFASERKALLGPGEVSVIDPDA
ncbi:MAG TPA: asparagine synthetase B, partial [Thermoanaerobaculia bacterium]|nr:asparagine synthetase B [Thermoanaerobaculia bacterium]